MTPRSRCQGADMYHPSHRKPVLLLCLSRCFPSLHPDRPLNKRGVLCGRSQNARAVRSVGYTNPLGIRQRATALANVARMLHQGVWTSYASYGRLFVLIRPSLRSQTFYGNQGKLYRLRAREHDRSLDACYRDRASSTCPKASFEVQCWTGLARFKFGGDW